jgi:putative transposase
MKTVNGQVYHVLNKSIAGYKIFNNRSEFDRMLERVIFYQSKKREKFSTFNKRKDYKNELKELTTLDGEKEVEIIAYCLMPTHFHLLLKQLTDNGISNYLNILLNSYTRYFNTKHKRKGPLWTGRSKKLLVETDEQLLHLTRYIHLNPATSYLVDKPGDWSYSSYKEYLKTTNNSLKISKFDDLLDIDTKRYRKFVEDTVDYQRNLKKIKDLLLE